ncbi:Spo12 family-containing protein [Strongyloides ratti]|uniref:Spo12 family-containing protein n=1 Tax=Strongyloides ratti TaxID=34506 RepID=A0A090L317_STRRB|nr:Spo12 family-containing protein [Strongyloides ratti]CEF62512.1 Spo12 family-containing protein [Strongyloides ratti]
MENKQPVENQFLTPNRSNSHENSYDSGKGSDITTPTDDKNKSPPIKDAHSTPAIIKLRKAAEEFHTFSPSDNMLSPCTRKLFANKIRNKKFVSNSMNIHNPQ